MRVFQIQDDWSVDNLKIAERPKQEPGPAQVLLKMKAASLNYRDLVVLQKGYGHLTGTLPLIPVSDGVGVIVETGKSVKIFKPGDRVCPMFMPEWKSGEPTKEIITSTLGGPIDGVMTEYMLINEKSISAVPDFLSDKEASTLPCAALTAWTALHIEGGVKKGDKVLIQGSGGVSIFALQFAQHLGAEVFIVSGSDKKLERAITLGAKNGLNYNTIPEWGKEINKMAGKDGIDHIVDVGGEKTLPQSLRAVRPGGTISLIGVLSGAKMNVNLGLIVTRKIRLQGITVGHREGFKEMTEFIDKHQIIPVIDKVFAFEELPVAFKYLASGKHFGKVCIKHE
ncbi:NAD(P)-dependent alcohol dehydrogenase [Bacteroidota bacterium]